MKVEEMNPTPVPMVTVITRTEAKQIGLKRYYSGKKCRVGHYSERYTSTAQCIECKRRFKDSEQGQRYRLLEKAKRRARKKGLEFSITLGDITIPARCPLLGVEIQLGGDGLFNMNSPSLDRIDNSKGYVKGNVAVISLKANKLKSDLSVRELQSLASALASYISQSDA